MWTLLAVCEERPPSWSEALILQNSTLVDEIHPIRELVAACACRGGLHGSLFPQVRRGRRQVAITGLIHAFDYEKYPTAEEHLLKGNQILAERGCREDIRRAIMGHAMYSGVPRDTRMAQMLFACDQLAGFITAVALVKSSKSLQEVDAKSVRKRMKDKAFARSVNREDIVNGAVEMGLDLDAHIAFCVEAMRSVANEFGLAGIAPVAGAPSEIAEDSQ